MKHLKDAPRYDGKKDLKETVRQICDWLFQLKETLDVTLQNIGPDNLNPVERKKLEDRLARMEQQLKQLSEGVGT